MGFCKNETCDKEVSAFSNQALTDGTGLCMVGVISVEEGKVRGSVNKRTSCLGSTARSHTSL